MGTNASISAGTILAIVLIIAALPAAASAGATAQQPSNQTIDNTPTFDGGPIADDPASRRQSHKAPGYACPSTPYIDCMPPVKKSVRQWCDSEYREWAVIHCPGVKFLH